MKKAILIPIIVLALAAAIPYVVHLWTPSLRTATLSWKNNTPESQVAYFEVSCARQGSSDYLWKAAVVKTEIKLRTILPSAGRYDCVVMAVSPKGDKAVSKPLLVKVRK